VSARALLEELRRRDVHLEAHGLMLRVDAPSGEFTEELRAALAEHKHSLIRLLEKDRRRLEDADRRGLVIRWSREPGYVSIHDPTTGEWHEVAASGCPPWVPDAAKVRRRFGGLKR
jgi:TubC N-terminal docking domain